MLASLSLFREVVVFFLVTNVSGQHFFFTLLYIQTNPKSVSWVEFR